MNDNITMETMIVATWDDEALDIRPRDDMDDEEVERKKKSDGGC
jgi:hypothetical protein